MKTSTRRFIVWLMRQTRITRCFVIAIMFHTGLLIMLGSITIVKKVSSGTPWLLKPVEGLTDLQTPANVLDRVRLPDEPQILSLPRGNASGTEEAGSPSHSTGISTLDSRLLHAGGTVIGPDWLDSRRINISGGTGNDFGNMRIVSADDGTGFFKGTPFGVGYGQRTESNIRKLVRENNRDDTNTEVAVTAALRWLKTHQDKDGSWSMGCPVQAGTALALLAYCGHGELVNSREFEGTVTKGFQYLISQVKSNGEVSNNMYVEGLVGLALAEAYGLTGSPKLREPLEQVVQFILKAQRTHKTNPIHEGGWRYSPVSVDADLSVAGWQIMALKSAKTAGIDVPQEAFDMAADYVWNMYGTAGFGYSTPGASPNLTAVGVLCQQFLGNGKDKRIRPALDALAKNKMNWETAKGGFILYGWYYMVQAIYQGDDKHWTEWNAAMKKALLDSQQEDGHWGTPDGSTEKNYGPVYSTTLCTLMLEVYYRHLPMYRPTNPDALKQSPKPLKPASYPALQARL